MTERASFFAGSVRQERPIQARVCHPGIAAGRVRELADPAYQARLQAITSMAFTLGFSLGMLWAGVAIDQYGLVALAGGAAFLGLVSVAVVVVKRS